MPCKVTLCDTSFAAVTNGKIDIEAYDPPGIRTIDKQSNGFLGGGEWGAVLTVASQDIYDVVIDTSNTPYAPPVLQNFSGAGAPQLDVVLHSTAAAVAAGSTGTPPSTGGGLSRFVFAQNWPSEAKEAILTSADTLVYVKRLPPSEFPRLRDFLYGLFRRLRVDPDIIG
jgi:hypothetical protein